MTQEMLDPQDPQSTSEELHFGHFAEIPEYIEVNRELIQRLFQHLPNPFVLVDVATGTGLVPQLLIKEAERHGYSGTIIGIDPNPDSLAIARERTPESNAVTTEFILGHGQETDRLVAGKIPEQGADAVTIHDAIHEVEGEQEKRKVFAAMARILKPGGVLTYNSAFTTIAMRGSELDWGKLKARALRSLRKRRDRAIEALKVHAPGEYGEMIRNQGLEIVHEKETEVSLTRKALMAISLYPEFISGFFRDMVDENSVSLQRKYQALIDSITNIKKDALPRIWHEIIAQKPPLRLKTPH
ncbi:methyltransferase domain-containing protein [Patescibacteria group bacterium]|nr:methyltransferase domain-containing protein [Patescibacteria group bacterium]